MRVMFAVAIGVLCARLPAVEAGDGVSRDEPTSMLTVSIADGARLRAHWQASVYAQVWDGPTCDVWRRTLSLSFPNLQGRWELSPFALGPELVSCSIRFFPPARTAATAATRFAIQLDCGAASTRFYSKLADQGKPASVAGADAAAILPDGTLAALFGTTMILSSASLPIVVHQVAASVHDISIAFDARGLASAFQALNPYEPEHAQLIGIVAALAPVLARGSMDVDIVEQGLQTHYGYGADVPWLVPVGRPWLGYLPNTVFCCAAAGIDGAALWRDLMHPLLSSAGAAMGDGVVMQEAGFSEAACNAALARNGISMPIKDLVSGISGTVFLAISSSAPFPGFTVGLPATPAVDRLMAAALAQMLVTLPAPGQSVTVSSPDFPVPLQVVRNEHAWVVTSDEQMVKSWSVAPTSEWTATALGSMVVDKLHGDACAFSATQMATALRTIQGFLAIGLNATRIDDAKKRGILVTMQEITNHAGMDCDVTCTSPSGLHGESVGLLGAGLPSALVAGLSLGVGLPKLIASFTPQPFAAARLLLTQVFPGEIQFREKAYRKRGHDGTGDYGFLSELAGGHIVGQPDSLHLSLLGPRWNSMSPTIAGYRFAVYLPDGAGGALGAGDDSEVHANAGQRGPHDGFVAYAWPVAASAGALVFAMTDAGTVYMAPADHLHGLAPAWNELFANKGWDARITWEAVDPPVSVP